MKNTHSPRKTKRLSISRKPERLHLSYPSGTMILLGQSGRGRSRFVPSSVPLTTYDDLCGKFISCEPLLGPLSLKTLDDLSGSVNGEPDNSSF